MSAGGHSGMVRERLDSHPCHEHHFSKVRHHHTSNLSPQARPLIGKYFYFFSLLGKPIQGGHGPTTPNLTDLILKAFHPLPTK